MKKLLLLIILVLLLYIFHAQLLAAYARLFTVNNATEGADAMIILSGNIDTRPRYAAQLYQQGYAQRVFLTREKNWEGKFSPYVEARNAYAFAELERLGLPVEWLPSTHEDGAMSTMDEALDTVDFLSKNESVQHLILVTDAPHSYRTHYAFQQVLEDNGFGHIRLEMAAAPNDIFDESNWYKTEKGLLYYFSETIKLLFYWANMANTSLFEPL